MTKKTKITKFDRATVRQILAECEEALRPVAEKHGLTLDRKGKTYYQDALPVMFQLLITKLDEDGNVLTADAKAFQQQAFLYGLEPSDLGREFRSRGDTFRITGLRPRSRKYPILAENVKTGKTYKFHAETVKAGLKAAA